MRRELNIEPHLEYVDESLRGVYEGRVPGQGADLVTYWFEKARERAIERQRRARAGVVCLRLKESGADSTAWYLIGSNRPVTYSGLSQTGIDFWKARWFAMYQWSVSTQVPK